MSPAGLSCAGRAVRAAIVSDNAKVRFVVSAISLFNPGHRSFSRAELPQALKHLQVSELEAAEVYAALEQLERLMAG